MILIYKKVHFYQEINQLQCIAKQNKLKQQQCTPTIFLYNPTFTFSPSFETAGPSHCWLPVVIDNKGKIMAKNVQHPHGFEVTDVQEKPIAARVSSRAFRSTVCLSYSARSEHTTTDSQRTRTPQTQLTGFAHTGESEGFCFFAR